MTRSAHSQTFTPASVSPRGTPLQALPKYYFHALLWGMACIAVWESLGLDVPLAQFSFSIQTQSFEWRQHWFLTTVLHGALKNVLTLAVLGILIVACLPHWLRRNIAFLGRLSRLENVLLFLMVVSPAALVSLIKSQSLPFCPWDEVAFGGAAAQYQWWQPLFQEVAVKFGRCWPAGHASAGFGVLGAYFFARLYAPQWATKLLMTALCLGCVMGVSQQIRGAHFMSHTLWTAWLAWAACGLFAPFLKKMYAGGADAFSKSNPNSNV